MSNDDTPRLDRARLERLLGKESASLHAAWESQLTEPDRLRNERDALLRYARALERTYIEALEQVTPHRRRQYPKVGPFRAEHGVAALLEDDEPHR